MLDKRQSSICSFWAHLAGSVHPDDNAVFDRHPNHTFKLQFPPTPFVGRADTAPVVILMLNGGYGPGETEAGFPDEAATAEYLKYIREGEVPPRGRYYTSLSYWDLIAAGKAVLVNAVPYRFAGGLSKNKGVAEQFQSLDAHRRWLTQEVLPEATVAIDLFLRIHWLVEHWEEEYAGPERYFLPVPGFPARLQ